MHGRERILLFFHDTDAGCLGRAVLFLRTGVHSVTAFGGKHGVYPRDPAESLPNGEMEQPGNSGSDHYSGIYVYLFRAERLLLV